MMKKEYVITELADLDIAIADLRPSYANGMIYLHGDLGTGKTTFVKHWLQALGYQGVVTSPTYAIVNDYQIGEKQVYHADLYRLASPDELLYLGCEDWDAKKQLIFIEWPQRGDGFLPEQNANATFMLDGTSRKLLWESC